MPARIELTIDTLTGDLLIAHDADASTLLPGLGVGRALGCARPLTPLPPPAAPPTGACLRIADYYHGSLVDGPGRRSVVRCQGCPLGCPGFIYSTVGATKAIVLEVKPRPARSRGSAAGRSR
jgi:hypothetical protein